MIKEETIPQMFLNRANNYKDKTLIECPNGGKYSKVSWHDYSQMVEYFSMYLLSLGIKKCDIIAVLSDKRPEWLICDMAIISIGAINATTIPSYGSLRIQALLADCNPKVIVISNDAILRGISLNEQAIAKIITFDKTNSIRGKKFISFEECLDIGKELTCQKERLFFINLINEIKEDDVATIIYSINATQDFKGVMLTHKNLLSNCRAIAKVIPVGNRDKVFSFNPFAFVYGRICGYYLLLYCGAIIIEGSLYSKIIRFQYNEASIIVGNPSVFKLMYKFLLGRLRKIHKNFPLKRAITLWPIINQRKYIKASSMHKRIPLFSLTKYLVAELVTFFLKRFFTKSKLRFLTSSGAYLDKNIPRFFSCIGFPILEGYGLTECCVVSVNTLKKCKIETVGRVLPDVEVRIDRDGEILVKGDNIMKGYYNGTLYTDNKIMDGWFRTGDIGQLDCGHFITIKKTKKENFFGLDNGFKINPEIIEKILKGDEYIKDVAVFGDRKPYLVALLAVNSDKLKKDSGINHFLLCRIKERLIGLSNFEQINNFVILDEGLDANFSKETLYRKYETLIERMYTKF